jgi:phosphoribosylglycinamide formyltransferase-1
MTTANQGSRIEKIGILLSGRGSNMRALVEATRSGRIPAAVALVFSNKADAPGLAWAREQGLETACLDHRDYPDRKSHEQALVEHLDKHGVELICLAGYMRLLSAWLVKRYAGRILNIHPSLLPSFTGLDGQQQAFEYGVKVAGCTVHIVDEELDHGPILVQRSVPVLEDDSAESLAARILEQEHLAYPEAVRLMCSGRVRLEGRRARILPEAPDREGEPH